MTTPSTEALKEGGKGRAIPSGRSGALRAEPATQSQAKPPATIAGHTPGPWRQGADLIRVHTNWRDDEGSCTPENFHRNGYAKTIAAVGKEDGDWRPISQQVADARLIASAPELLEALKALQLQALQSADLRATEWGVEALALTRAAIQKATGAAK